MRGEGTLGLRRRPRLLLLAAAAVAVLAPSAHGAPAKPHNWDNLHEPGTPTEEPNTTEAGLARTADGVLHIVWVHDRGNGQKALLHVATAGKNSNLVGETPNVIAVANSSAGQAFNPSVDLVLAPNGGLRVFFSGLFPGQPIDGVMATSTAPPSGATWTAPVPASGTASGQRSPVYAASGIGADVDNEGIFTSAWGDSDPSGGGYHVGLGAGPDSPFSPACCEIDPGVGSDSQTGETMVAVNLIDSGIQIRSVDSGLAYTAPESVAAFRQQRTSITGRIGAPGIYVGYGTGTNQYSARPAVWEVGAERFLFLKNQDDAAHVGIAAAPGGRIWLYWERDGVVHATRSNPSVTKFGRIVKVKPPFSPSASAMASSVYRLGGEGSEGRLHLLALVGFPNGETGYRMGTFLPGLTLKADPKKVKAGDKVEFTVLDAGDPVKGADVRIAKGTNAPLDKGKTDSDGKLKLKVPGDANPGSYRAVATFDGAIEGVSGYDDTEVAIRVKG